MLKRPNKSLPHVIGTSLILLGTVSNSSIMWTSSPVREVHNVTSISILQG